MMESGRCGSLLFDERIRLKSVFSSWWEPSMRLHLSTAIVLMLSVAVLLGLNLSLRSGIPLALQPHLPEAWIEESQSMGWPWPYYYMHFERKGRVKPDGDIVGYISREKRFDPTAVGGDAFVGLIILVVLVGTCETVLRVQFRKRSKTTGIT